MNNKFSVFVVGICLCYALTASLAYASVSTTPLVVSANPTVGGVVTLSISLTDYLTSGYDWEQIQNIDYRFTSGNGGPDFVGSIQPNTYTTSIFDFSHAFTYTTPGMYWATFDASVNTLDGYHQMYCSRYGCYYNYYTAPLVSATSASTLFYVAPAVPEPETYLMLLAGLGVIVFASLRRKNQTGTMNFA